MTKNNKLYQKWANMKQRCNNPNYIEFRHYGGRGITYDQNWETFDGFMKGIGSSYTEGMTLDRKDNDKGYFIDNCQWIPKSEQPKNRRCIRWITFDGVKKSMADWARHIGVKRTTLIMRIDYYKWSPKRALTEATNEFKKY